MSDQPTEWITREPPMKTLAQHNIATIVEATQGQALHGNGIQCDRCKVEMIDYFASVNQVRGYYISTVGSVALSVCRICGEHGIKL